MQIEDVTEAEAAASRYGVDGGVSPVDVPDPDEPSVKRRRIDDPYLPRVSPGRTNNLSGVNVSHPGRIDSGIRIHGPNGKDNEMFDALPLPSRPPTQGTTSSYRFYHTDPEIDPREMGSVTTFADLVNSKDVEYVDAGTLSSAFAKMSFGGGGKRADIKIPPVVAGAKGDYPLNSYLAAAKYVMTRIHVEHDEEQQRRRLRSRLEILHNPRGTDENPGQLKFRRMLAMPHKIIANYQKEPGSKAGMALDPVQAKFIEEFIFASAHHVYGSDWKAQQGEFLREYGRQIYKQQVLVLSPRRYGKTWAICLFVLSAMWLIPGVNIIVLSQNKRTSAAILDQVKQFLSFMPGGQDRLVDVSAEFISMLPEQYMRSGLTVSQKRRIPLKSTLRALPCTANGVRGTGGHIVILEETAFMPRVVFETVVVPIVSKTDVTLCAISTPNTRDNYYSDLLLMIDPRTGLQFFKTLMIGLVCESCRATGNGSNCPHRRNLLPSWHSYENQLIAKAIMSDELYRQEQQGQIVNDKREAFNPLQITDMFREERRVRFRRPVGVMFMAIDPSGGGKSKSELACVAMAINREHQRVVVGIAHAFIRTHYQEEQFIHKFMTALRSEEGTPYHTSVVVDQIEADLAQQFASRFAALLDHHQPIEHTLTLVDGEFRHGVWTKGNKQRYLREMERELSDRKIVIASDCVCLTMESHPTACNTYSDPKASIGLLEKQLRDYVITEQTTNHGGEMKTKWGASGKHKGPDDLATALMICNYNTNLRLLDTAWVDGYTRFQGRKVIGNE